ncbi:MAG: phosphoribosylamine--glycine ligase [Flavobacteriales bacterium]|jgi:phosphoribosylamine--glycine ligase|uniref:phosphoribosylamine--glycine ligase n=1 Tax=Blattabacterium sp. (Mastotermes darwiniensis) TaxID=39768 RepID=UPI000231DDD2|nr:phosphoribosylamine--glycine ligase [Blattabacterium sp. (Mastotermes darwiniensis)]AER40518.1 Phosphoribosylamine--glycine ligase [Blattabacterium sp. (Mastotermes darwiniensis) str. MADAR]MDR1804967.1 phosphoribosylamine--glycine ligase [Flavobacteriales bacterium]
MKVLILGNGGREHAIGKKIFKDCHSVDLYFYPGNGGTNQIGKNIEDHHTTLDLCLFAKKNSIDLTIVGSETFLYDGIVDVFKNFGLAIMGAHYLAARLEVDRVFSKSFMKKYGVRTPKYKVFSSYQKAVDFLEKTHYSVVIKTSGIAAGKGVILAKNKTEAKNALNSIMIDKKFGKSGNTIIIEEFLKGQESSIISIFNGKEITPFLSAKDYKKIGEKETGSNTGGMGTIVPNPYMTNEVWMDFKKNILTPTLEGLLLEKLTFFGFIYFGLMITSNNVYLLEYNTRMGDPETQALLPLMNSNFFHIIQSALLQKKVSISWKKLCSCCVVLSSKGYPEKYESGKIIKGLNSLMEPFYIAGAKKEKERWITSHGRVLNMVGLGKTMDEAIKMAYNKVKKIHFENLYYRKDIGL